VLLAWRLRARQRSARDLWLFSKAMFPMNVSKCEQRVLHALAQGAEIRVEKDGNGKIQSVICVTREGWVLADCNLPTFRRLKRRRLIGSVASAPYRITRDGLAAVRAQFNNR
jgi:uncharacterized protein YjhX (UPF0386 family)